LTFAWLLALLAAGTAAAAPPQSGTDLDELMREVLERRDANRDALARLEFSETETMRIRDQDTVAPIQSYVKEFVWGMRVGVFLRLPVRVNGVDVVPAEQGAAARAWQMGSGDSERELSTDGFYDWDSFFNFRFEPGNYYLAGREVFEGREVLRIEYYPTHLFSRAGEADGLIGAFDRTTVVSMLVLPDERQIIAWTFENVGLEFLPARWLARVGTVDVSMVLDSGPDDTWLPREIRLATRANVATSILTIEMTRRFDDFVEADTGRAIEASVSVPAPAQTTYPGSGEAVTGRISELRFHGNHSIPSDELKTIAGVQIGEPFSVQLAAAVEERLMASDVVDRAEVRPRHASLGPSGDVALLVVVHESVSFFDRFQFLPYFQWSDEYGITVGGTVTVLDLYGDDERLSFPLAIGGRDIAAVEFTDDFQRRLLTGVRAGFGYRREVNPHFDETEERVAADVSVFRRVGRLQLEVAAGWADVTFGGEVDQQASGRLAARVDTRNETGLPRNALYVETAWSPLQIIDKGPGFNRFELDVRGYLGGFGRSTIAIGGQLDTADGVLPDYERYLLGGMSTLRGFDAGAFVGDNRVFGSAELRVPVWEPLPIVLVGVSGFWDTGAVWDYGASLRKTKFHNGVGGGVFLFASFVQLSVDVAYGLEDGWNFHIGSGLRY